MEIPILQDIRKYKTKDIGNFSFKEAGFLALGVGSAFIVYKFAGNSMELAMLPLMVFVVIGFFKPFGMTFTEFVRTVLKEQMSVQTYIWETDFEYNADEFDELYGEHIQVSPEWSVIQTDNPVKTDKSDKARIIR